MKVGFPLWTASVYAAPWCVCVIDIGQSSHYWNSSAQSRRKGIKNKNENRTSFDDNQCHLLLEDFPFVTSQMGRRNPSLDYMHYAVSYSYNLLTNAAVYNSDVFFPSEIASFSSNNLILISILHRMLLVWISPYLWMRLYIIHNNSQTKLVWANWMYQISPAVYYMRAR